MKLTIFLIFLFAPAFLAAQSGEQCGKLDHKLCIMAEHCIIDHVDRKKSPYDYICRPRHRPCEIGLPTEMELRKAECKKRSGCSMQGNCYCSCDDKLNANFNTCDCECGGGLPPDCREIKN